MTKVPHFTMKHFLFSIGISFKVKKIVFRITDAKVYNLSFRANYFERFLPKNGKFCLQSPFCATFLYIKVLFSPIFYKVTPFLKIAIS